jgi:hypothetical protein
MLHFLHLVIETAELFNQLLVEGWFMWQLLAPENIHFFKGVRVFLLKLSPQADICH